MRYAILLLALVLPSAASPQAGARPVHLEPGSERLAAERITTGSDTLVLVMGRGDQLDVRAVFVLDTHLHTLDGREVITRVERFLAAGDRSIVVDSFVVARRTLAPLSAAPSQTRGGEVLAFAPDQVVHRGAGGGTTIVVDRPAFYGNSLDVVLRALPLREGFQATLPLYRADDRAISDARVTVAGVEEVQTASGGLCRAWRISVEDEGHGGTYWISVDSPALVQFESEAPPLRLLRLGGCTAGPRSASALPPVPTTASGPTKRG